MVHANELNSAPRRRVQSGQMDAHARAMKGWSARVAGMSWREVAQVCGWSSAAVACRAVKRFMGSLPAENREDQRQLWRQRHEALWRIALEDARQRKPGAVRAAAAVSLRAAQLDGLDEPQRTRVEYVDYSDPAVWVGFFEQLGFSRAEIEAGLIAPRRAAAVEGVIPELEALKALDGE